MRPIIVETRPEARLLAVKHTLARLIAESARFT